jgi:NADH-quinone oxidoreductase subunit F
MSNGNRITSAEDLAAAGKRGLAMLYPDKPRVAVSTATCGLASGAGKVYDALVERLGGNNDVTVSRCGCLGYCQAEPLVTVYRPGRAKVVYQRIKPDMVDELTALIIEGREDKKLALCRMDQEEFIVSNTTRGLTNGSTDAKASEVPLYEDIPFFKKQLKIVLRNCGFIDSDSIDEYIARDGYSAALKALTSMDPEEVIEQVKQAGLRGRGGAGFPTGLKWQFARDAAGTEKYLICNADEGDPGAYMDRSVLECDPHSVLEGMLIGAYAIGAQQGIIYVRTEYPLAIEKLRRAIGQAQEYGLLGENIFGTGFCFDIGLVEGSGAFVCGEETSLIGSIEGRVAEPRSRPPFPAQSGLWGKPTNINNVETWANIPVIIARGGKWYSGIGTRSSKGTKVFSLVGKINRTGLVEVPMGISLSEIVYDIGGGVAEKKKLKAIQTGGPSGGCIPASLVEMPVDYEKLAEAGSIMGSGGMVVMDEDTCMVDIARFFTCFTRDESCGKCISCRDGLDNALRLLEKITAGAGNSEDLGLLDQLCRGIRDASQCGLGTTAANPILSTMKYFRDEYEAHIQQGRCSAGACPELVYAPCANACPAGVDVPLYISLIGANRLEEAIASHLERNPFPSICARVCPHPCESKCRRVELDAPVAIRSLKRYMADTARRIDPHETVRENEYCAGIKVAVIGAGPGGLSCAYFLRRMGYSVTVFEKEERPGGMMAYAIPEYRLPRDILEKEIDWVLGTGIELKLNTEVGKDVTIDELKSRGYKAFFLGLGAWEGMSLRVPGEEIETVMQGLDFLIGRNKGRDIRIGKKVAVIGGGDVAIDSARMAFRMGAEVTVVYRRTREEMPAIETEIEQAQAEGIRFEFLATPDRIEGGNGAVGKLVCRRMKLGEYALDGRRRPEPTDEVFELDVDTVIAAVGQRVSAGAITEQTGIELGRWGQIQVDPFTQEMETPMFFAGGDAVTGPSIVLEAVGAGERAAVAISEKLSKELAPEDRPEPFWRRQIENDTCFDPEAEPVKAARLKQETLALEARRSFEEVELAISKDGVCLECPRCLRCDYRTEE